MKKTTLLFLLVIISSSTLGFAQEYSKRNQLNTVYPSNSESDGIDVSSSSASNTIIKGNLTIITEDFECGMYTSCLSRVFDRGVLIYNNSYGWVTPTDKILNGKYMFELMTKGVDEKGPYFQTQLFSFNPKTNKYQPYNALSPKSRSH